jgi:hypothetical protein
MLIERLVILFLQIGFRARPEGFGLIQRLFDVGAFQGDRNAQVIRVLAHQLAQAACLEEFLVLISQVQNHFGAAV